MASDQWYYAQNGERLGPVSLETLRALLANSSVKPADYVWCQGMENWQPAGTIAELAMPSAAAPGIGYAPPSGYANPAAQTSPSMMGYYNPAAPAGSPPPYAGFWMRFAAAFLDGIILWVVGILVMLGVTAMSGSFSPVRGARRAGAGGEIQLMGNCFTIIIQLLYYTIQESSSAQATLGKRAVGIRVTNLFGDRITYGQALGRFFGKWVSWIILGFGFFMAGWTQRKQALHDMMAGTLVVRNS